MLTANVVFATMTGNNEEVANIVSDALTKGGVEVNETEISQTEFSDFEQADILVVCAYTYDEGAMPEEGMDFFDDLNDAKLTGKVFGVAGSGDRFYGEFFNTTVDHFDDAFEQAGATRGGEKIKIDLEPYEEDVEKLGGMAQGLIKCAKEVQSL